MLTDHSAVALLHSKFNKFCTSQMWISSLIYGLNYPSLAGIIKSIHRDTKAEKKKNFGKGKSRDEGLAHGNRKHPVMRSVITVNASSILFLHLSVSQLNIYVFSCL